MNLKRTIATAALVSLFALGGPPVLASEEQPKLCAEDCNEAEKAGPAKRKPAIVPDASDDASGDASDDTKQSFWSGSEAEYRSQVLWYLNEIRLELQRIR